MLRVLNEWSGKETVRLTPFPLCARKVASARKVTRLRLPPRTGIIFDRKARLHRIAREERHYSTVQIGVCEMGYCLVYGDNNYGTGMFTTRQEAIEWFLNNGR
jgi:hypothetical protein